MPWDFPEYCQECFNIGVGRGLDMKKEIRLVEQWQPLHTSHILVETPRVFADQNGILLAWVLPSIISPILQVCEGYSDGGLISYMNLSFLESTLHCHPTFGRYYGGQLC